MHDNPPNQQKNFMKPFLLPVLSAMADKRGETRAIIRNAADNAYVYKAVLVKSRPKKRTMSDSGVLVTDAK